MDAPQRPTSVLNVFLCFFFQDEEQEVFKRDFSAPTLEDHFNKTILPKVMQVSWIIYFIFCTSHFTVWKAGQCIGIISTL